MMVGEHDWYLDMGEKWRALFGKDIYSFDHKGVHFVVLNSVIVEDYWTAPQALAHGPHAGHGRSSTTRTAGPSRWATRSATG